MTPETINALINMGSAGAVIAVVILFLRSNEKRDIEWRAFFSAINAANSADICRVVERLERVAASLDAHDRQAAAVKQLVEQIKSMLEAQRQPARKRGANE